MSTSINVYIVHNSFLKKYFKITLTRGPKQLNQDDKSFKLHKDDSNNTLYFLVACPHCLATIQIYQHEVNCKIFRHGVYKATMQNMNPHASKQECDFLFMNGLIHGCGKPFQILLEPDLVSCRVESCGYI